MSAKERFGTLVWLALQAVHEDLAPDKWGWHTVGEVAAKGEVSRATAKKYLEELVKMNNCRVVRGKGGRAFYQPIMSTVAYQE